MKLVPALLRRVLPWRGAFAQNRSFLRFLAVMLGMVCGEGRRTVTSSIRFRDRESAPWAADYLLFSRAAWDLDRVMSEVFAASVGYLDGMGRDLPVVLALDDTALGKSSRVIAGARWMRDPQSPAFHKNLKYGLRYLHSAVILPLHRLGYDPRAISVGFELAPAARKPGRRASDEERHQFVERKKQANLSQRALRTISARRAQLDQLAGPGRRLLVVGDGSYTNKVVLRGLPATVEYLGRTRKNLALYRPAPSGGRRVYGERLATPEEMRVDDSLPYVSIDVHYGGALRTARYKEVSDVLWQPVGRRRLRLIIVAPTPYSAPAGGKKRRAYTAPAYLLTTDLLTPAPELIQSYLDRWQIEVVHRDLKSGLGVGQAQVWAPESVERLHTSLVGMWSMTVLATLDAFGPGRTDDFGPLPHWRNDVRPAHRASQRDIARLARWEIAEARRSAVSTPGSRTPSTIDKSPTTSLIRQPP